MTRDLAEFEDLAAQLEAKAEEITRRFEAINNELPEVEARAQALRAEHIAVKQESEDLQTACVLLRRQAEGRADEGGANHQEND